MTGRLRPLTRRTLLTDFGAAGIGLIVLGACGGSSGSAGSPDPAGPDSTGPDSTEPSATEPTVTAGPSAADEIDENGDPSGNGLRLQHVSLGFVSAYVLVRGNEAAIVDTGQSESRDAIFEGLEALSVGPSAVRHIVLTHNHGDHVGGLSDLESELGNATVYVGPADIGAIRTSLTLAEANDGDEVFGMGIVATPGHTPGSISLFDTESGILVAGDAVNGDGAGGLTGANPSFSSDMDAAATSVATLAALMPTTVAFGHGGPPVTDGASAELAALV